jgi:transcriptional regulator with XRE-family HTH domain
MATDYGKRLKEARKSAGMTQALINTEQYAIDLIANTIQM